MAARSKQRKLAILGGLSFDDYLNSIEGLNLRFPLQETDGLVAGAIFEGVPNAAYDGTHTTVTVGVATGIASTPYAARYNGATSYTDIYSAELNSYFNPDELTIVAFMKVANAGVWTDGANRRFLELRVDGLNTISGYKIDNNIVFNQTSGGVSKGVTIPTTTTDYFMVALTASVSDNQLIVYYNGAQSGAIQTNLGTWVGNLLSTNCVIGAFSTTPTNVWSGDLNYDPILANRALTPGEIADIYQRWGG